MKLPKIINRTRKQKQSIEECLKEIALEIRSEDGRIKKSKGSLSFLTEKLKISDIEVKILSCVSFSRTFSSNNYNDRINIFQIKDILKEDFKEDDVSSDKILNKSIKNLLELNYIFNGGYSGKEFTSSDYFLKILENNEIKEEKIDNLDTLDLIILISNYIYELTAEKYSKKRYMTSDFCYRKVSEFIEHNKTLNFSKELTNIILEIRKDLKSSDSKKNQDILSFLYIVCDFVIKGRTTCNLDDFTAIYDEDPSRVYSEFRYGSNILLVKGFIEETGTNWRGLGIYGISSEVKDTLLKEIETKEVKDSEFIYPESIVEKELFYDQFFYDKIKDLYSFLDEDRFKVITDQLKEKGFKTGFTCLFYGSPGTGKTETVYQISKATNRPVFQIDLSSIRDKYVGESEKRLKSIFTKYKKRIKNKTKKIPIMFFNEADGIINNRLESQRDSVDKMENTLQNILLQELEDFEGILIATTNLQGNLDKAFDRRFLYKLNFKTPSPEIKAKIWMSKIENLPGEIAIKLSKEFDFSGGQIDNIARKYMIQKILHNKTEDEFELLFEYSKEENIEKHGKIGFLPSL